MAQFFGLIPLNAANFESGAAENGHVLTADGEGGASFQAVEAGINSQLNPPAMLVSDAGTAQVNGVYLQVIEDNGKPVYAHGEFGLAWEPYGEGQAWVLKEFTAGVFYYALDDVATPDMVSEWFTDQGEDGTPNIDSIYGVPSGYQLVANGEGGVEWQEQELPDYGDTNTGSVLTVIDADGGRMLAWAPGGLPDYTEDDAGKFLRVMNLKGLYPAWSTVAFPTNLVNGAGVLALAQEQDNNASGASSLAVGSSTTASADMSFSHGFSTVASGQQSEAGGSQTVASGQSAHAEGQNTVASGQSAHAEGAGTEASGMHSHAEGFGSIAAGKNSHAAGAGGHARLSESYAFGYSSSGSIIQHARYVLYVVGVYGGSQTLKTSSNEHITLPANCCLVFHAEVIGRSATFGKVAVYRFDGVVKNVGGSSAVVGSINRTVVAEDDASWDAAMTVDDVTDSLIITVNASSGDNASWGAIVSVTEMLKLVEI